MDPFAMTTDINGKPIPQWQARLEAMYTDCVPFAEILGYVRFLLEEHDVDAILNAPDEKILASFKGDIEQYATEMREKFDVIARLTRRHDQTQSALRQMRRWIEGEENPGEWTADIYQLAGKLLDY